METEGKFTGVFSAIQMFVVSDGLATKYFAAAQGMNIMIMQAGIR